MGSGSRFDPSFNSKAPQLVDLDKLARLGLSPRQQELNRLWSWYRCQSYEARRCDWDGKERFDPIEHEAVARAGYIPPGFYSAAVNNLPLKFRRPTTPYALVKVIVDRFTGLLFSERRHPQIRVDGDPETEGTAGAIAEASRLWSAMIQARTYGGATGTAVVGFQFMEGRPVVEVHDPRWVSPVFADRASLRLTELDKRYMYPADERDPQTGTWVQVWYWYRRLITAERDILWKPIVVGDGQEPDWEDPSLVEANVEHGFGFCPAVWIQNLPCADDADGDSDCIGIYDLVESIDALLAQANRGTVYNCFGRETPFVTDRGVRRFSDFADGDRVRVLAHTGEWREAIIKSFGRQRLQTVTMQCGPGGAPVAVRATRDHRWLLVDGSETTDLVVGDRLMAAPSKFGDFDYDRATPQEREFWCRGFVWGDGSRYAKEGCGVRLCGAKGIYAPRFVEAGFSVQLTSYGEPFASHAGVSKALPDVDGTPINLLRAFVRGFVDADGTKSKKRSTRWKRIQVTGDASVRFVRNVFPAVGLYISHEVDMTGTSTNYGARSATTIRFALTENASHHVNAEWRVTDIALGEEEEVWCMHTEVDRSLVLPFGVATGQCDPTVVINSPAEMPELQKGSDNALQVPGGDAKYMEITGSGPKAARELAQELRNAALEVAQCVLEQPGASAARTATEIERTYASMLAKADVLREQYGERGVKPLVEMMLKAARIATRPRVVGGSVERGVLVLPDKVTKMPDGSYLREPRKLGPVKTVTLQWGGYFEPSLQDAQQAVTAAAAAKAAFLVDAEHAARLVAEHFRVEDVPDMLAKIEQEKAAQGDQFAQQSLSDLNAGFETPPEPEPASETPPPAEAGAEEAEPAEVG